MPSASLKITAWFSLAACAVVIGAAIAINLVQRAAPVQHFALATARAPSVPHRFVHRAAPPPVAAPPVRSPGPRAAPPSTAASALGTALDAALAKLAPAQVAFTAPSRMELQHTQEIRAVLSLNLSGDALKALLPAGGRVEVDPLRVSDTMTASLYGEGFKIAPQNSQAQIVSHANTTEWHWFVTPTAAGPQMLFLDFTAHLSVGGQDAQRSIITREARINVVVGWPTTAQGWFDLLRKTIDDVGWLWTTLILPAALFVLRAWRRRHPATAVA